MTVAVIWLVIGIALFAAEVLSGELVLLMLGVGALGGAGVAALGTGLIVDVIVFAAVSVGLLVVARPSLKRRFLESGGASTNVDALLGTQALALSSVDENGGRVKLAGGEWSARTIAAGGVIEEGTTVTVVEIAGATAVVSDQL